jgi:hypothetical protein
LLGHPHCERGKVLTRNIKGIDFHRVRASAHAPASLLLSTEPHACVQSLRAL